jgi:hypothetical protein
MTNRRPAPPDDLPEELVDALDDYSPARLRAVASYAEALAAHRAQTDESRERDEVPAAGDDRPDDVPAKATLTVKEINDNRYYYWQWREGDKVKSKYEGPASGDS